MTKKTKYLGNDSGKSSDKHMAPSKPYTGDGTTRRSIFDGIKLVFKSGDKK